MYYYTICILDICFSETRSQKIIFLEVGVKSCLFFYFGLYIISNEDVAELVYADDTKPYILSRGCDLYYNSKR